MRQFALLSLLIVSAFVRSAHAHDDVRAQIEQLTEIMKKKPDDAMLWLKRGELYRAQHEYAHALSDYAQAEALDPGLEVVYLSRGRILYESSRFPDAYRALTSFLQMAPGHAEALLLRARTRIHLGQRNAAEQDFAAALTNSTKPTSELFLERASNLSQAGKAGAALAVLDQGITQLGPLSTLEEAALTIEQRSKRFDQALRRVDAMLARSEHKEELLARKAQILDAAGQKVAAREVREQALVQIEALPELKRKLESTKKLTHELQSGLARADSTRRR
jgi:predicted Zn-dependent protease